MATLEERLENEDYRHWVKATLCLQYTKDGLVPFADLKSQELHSAVLKQLRKNGNPSANGICASPRIDYKMRAMFCCGNCQAFLDEASKYCTGPGVGLGALVLNNSEITSLQKQHWQMAKLFMNPGQDVSNSDPYRTDISGILNFIEHCGLAKAAIQNTNYVTQVRDTRNRILHKADMKITKHDFSTNIVPALIALLQDPIYLLNNPAAQEAVVKIQQVESSSFHIGKDDEIQALKEMLADQNKRIQVLDTGVCDLSGSLQDLKTNIDESEETTGQEISKINRDLSTELEEQKVNIQEVQISIDRLKNRIKDDNELRDLLKGQVTVMLEIPLQDVRNQMKSLHQDQEELTVCLRVLKNRQDIEEKKTAKLQQEHGGLKNRLDIEEKKTADLQQEQGGLKNRLDIEEKKTAELQEEQGGLKSRLDIEARKRNQGLEALNIRMDNIDSKMATTQSSAQNLKESLTLVSPDDELELRQYLRDGYKETRLNVPTLPDCYTLPVSKLFAPVVILKEKKYQLKTSELLEQNNKDPNIQDKGEEQDRNIRSYKTMFYENGILQKQNYLLGKAGVGKTTFCKHLVDIWCNASQSSFYDDAGWLEKFEFVFHVECRHANESESVFDMICNQLIERESLKIVAKHVLNTKPDKCLVITDGLDEWKGSATRSAKTIYDLPGLPSKETLHNCVMLTTSRPWRVHALSQRSEQVGRVFELQGIDYVETLTTNILNELQEANPEHGCQLFLESVRASNLYPLVQTPLMLINLLTIWHLDRSLNPSICVNYSCMVEALIQHAKGESRRYEDLNRLTDDTVRGLSSLESSWKESAHLLPKCFQGTDLCKEYAGLIIKVGHLAFDLLVREKHEQSLVFTKQETKNYLTEKELKVCLTIGILSKSQSSGRGIQKMDVLCFSHKTFQEFLGSLWLSIEYSNNCDKFYECCTTLYDVLDYGVFVQFVCGFCPHNGKNLWQYIANEVIDKDANIQKERQKNIVTRAYTSRHSNHSLCKLTSLILSCNEEASHSYVKEQKIHFLMADLYIDPHSSEKEQSLFYYLLQNKTENIKSVVAIGNAHLPQIVSSINKMAAVVCISLFSGEFLSALTFASKDSPLPTLPQQLQSLGLRKWKIKGLWNKLPIQLTTLKFYALTMPHSSIEKLSQCLRTSLGLRYINLTSLLCIDHGECRCLLELDLQKHHKLEELELARVSVESLLLPCHQETHIRRLVFIRLTMSKQGKEQLSIALASCHDLQELDVSCFAFHKRMPGYFDQSPLYFQRHHRLKSLAIDIDIQKQHHLRLIILEELSCGSLILPSQPEACLRELYLHELTLSHQGIEQLCSWLAEYSSLQHLALITVSCSDHGEKYCLTEVDLQKHHRLNELKLKRLSVGNVMLPAQLVEECFSHLELHELTLAHQGKEQLCRWLAEYSSLLEVELNTVSCRDHGEKCCLNELDLQKHHSLEHLILKRFSVGNVMLPVQLEKCLTYLILDELTLTHQGIEELCRWLAEYSSLLEMELNTVSCRNHGETYCLTDLDLQKHHRLEQMILESLSFGSLVLPAQLEEFLTHLKLHELTLSHRGIEQLCRCLADYSSFQHLALITVSCSDHGEKCCLNELDLQKNHRLEQLILARLSVRNVMLPAQLEECLRRLRLHELTLTHQSIEQLCRFCLAEYSSLEYLELNTLSCSDHGEKCCLTELDLQKHHRLEQLILERLSVGNVMLPVKLVNGKLHINMTQVNMLPQYWKIMLNKISDIPYGLKTKLKACNIDKLACAHASSCSNLTVISGNDEVTIAKQTLNMSDMNKAINLERAKTCALL